MKRLLLTVVVLVLSVPSCAHRCGGRCERRETLAQVSTIDALLAGDYDGKLPCSDLLRYGGFGIGTFHGLDGEMVVLDGTVYQVDVAGKVTAMPRDTRTPFACVTSFEPDVRLLVRPKPEMYMPKSGGEEVVARTGLDFAGLRKLVDEKAGEPNLFLAVRVDGTFKHVKTRSVPAQTKPYPPLVEVTKRQATFEFKDVKGTIVGFRCPAFVKGVNVPGYHLHFLTADRRGGGHVLELTMERGVIGADVTPNFLLMLPRGGAFAELDLTTDREKDLHRAER